MSASVESFLANAEKTLDRLSRGVVSKTEDARVQAHLGIMDLNEHWQSTQAALLKSAGKLKAGVIRVRGEVDSARVMAHLAKEDATDAVANLKGRIHSIEGKVSFLRTSLAHESDAVLEGMSRSCRELSTLLDS